MKNNFNKFLGGVVLVFAFLLFPSLVSAATLNCPTDNGAGVGCSAGTYYCGGTCKSPASMSNLCNGGVSTIPGNPPVAGYDLCAAPTSCSSGYSICAGYPATCAINTVISNCASYSCGTCSSCSSGYQMCSGACAQVISCGLGQTFTCTGTGTGACTGTALSAIKLSFPESYSASALIQSSTTTDLSTLFLTNSGRLGIGTSSPAYKLDVNGTGAFRGDLNMLGNAIFSASQYGFNNGDYILQNSPSSYDLSIFTGSTPTNRLTITANGNIGLASTSPTTRLSIGSSLNTYGLDAGSLKIGSVAMPTIGTDVTTKTYVDGAIEGYVSTRKSGSAEGANYWVGGGGLSSYGGSLAEGSYNSSFGSKSLFAATTESNNSAFGYKALMNTTNGDSNTALGANAMENNITGRFNTALGYKAGSFLIDGTTPFTGNNYSVYLGSLAKSRQDGVINEIVIGYNANGYGANSVVIGNDSIATTILKGNVGIGVSVSSVADKLEINGAAYFDQITTPSSTTNRLYNVAGNLFWNGTQLGGGAAASYWTLSGSNLFSSSSSWNIGIGTSSPSTKLEVAGTVTATHFAGSLYPADIPAIGSFGSNTGGGNYVFPSDVSSRSLTVGSSTSAGPVITAKATRNSQYFMLFNDQNNAELARISFSGKWDDANYNNIFIGKYAGQNAYGPKTGTHNTAMGESAMGALGQGGSAPSYSVGDNSAFGALAMQYNNAGTLNSAFGSNAMNSNTSGKYNTAIGANALSANLTGGNNVAVGKDAASNGGGSYNTVIGTEAKVNAGNNNVVAGYSALGLGGSGSRNIILGSVAYIDSAPINDSVLAGSWTAYATGNAGVKGTMHFVNYQNPTQFDGVVAIGEHAGGVKFSSADYYGDAILSGSVFIGRNAGQNALINTPGTGRIIMIGDDVGANMADVFYQDSMIIGYGNRDPFIFGKAGTGNKVVVGIGTTTIFGSSTNATLTVGGPVAAQQFWYTSDRRLKKDITPLGDASEKLMKLKPVSFAFISDTNGDKSLGFIAQDVEQVFPDLVVTSKDDKKMMKYDGLFAPIVKTIQEQQAKIDTQEAQIQILFNRLNKYENNKK